MLGAYRLTSTQVKSSKTNIVNILPREAMCGGKQTGSSWVM